MKPGDLVKFFNYEPGNVNEEVGIFEEVGIILQLEPYHENHRYKILTSNGGVTCLYHYEIQRIG